MTTAGKSTPWPTPPAASLAIAPFRHRVRSRRRAIRPRGNSGRRKANQFPEKFRTAIRKKRFAKVDPRERCLMPILRRAATDCGRCREPPKGAFTSERKSVFCQEVYAESSADMLFVGDAGHCRVRRHRKSRSPPRPRPRSGGVHSATPENLRRDRLEEDSLPGRPGCNAPQKKKRPATKKSRAASLGVVSRPPTAWPAGRPINAASAAGGPASRMVQSEALAADHAVLTAMVLVAKPFSTP